jgi:peroxiredoxin Q/BCP
MAQLRLDYEKFLERETEVIVIGPEDEDVFRYHWKRGGYPFVGIADPDHKIADLYNQQFNLLKMGRMPAHFVINKCGFIRFQHHGDSMHDIVGNKSVLNLLDKINAETELTNN